MPSTTVNATRMELTRLKKKLKTAVRGHKLLKDKRDELMKQFLDMIRENRALRTRVEEALMRAHGSFTVASALMSSEMLEQSLLYPKQSVELNMSFKNIMSVDTPIYHFSTQNPGSGDIYPYSFATTSCELDGAVDALSSVPGYAEIGSDRKDHPAAGGRDRKDPPPRQCIGVRDDPRNGGEYQVHLHEAG